MVRPTLAGLLIAFSITLIGVACGARQQAQSQSPLFNRIFRQPTGKNGYEDIVLASDLIAHNPAMEVLKAQGATLTAKRRTLSDPELQKALAMMRDGLEKQVAAPPDGNDPDAPSPLLRLSINLLALGRLLAAEQYILLADGQTSAAIQNLRDGLRLGYAVRCQQAPVSGLVGIGIDSLLVAQVARHIDQFSEQDCDNLLQLIREWQNGDHSPLPALISEHDHTLQELGKIRKDPNGLLQAMRAEASSNENPDMAQLLADATAGSLVRAADAAIALYNQQFDHAIANMRVAPWQRQDTKLPDGNTLAYKIFRMVAPDFNKMMQVYDEDRANLQLLGVHAAIRKYRWQYDRLPDRLDQLHDVGVGLSDSLITDPFSGKPLAYRRAGNTYDLYSVGPYAHDETGARIPDKHAPITLSQ